MVYFVPLSITMIKCLQNVVNKCNRFPMHQRTYDLDIVCRIY